MDLDSCTVNFKYFFVSGLGPISEGRFVVQHLMQLNLVDEEGAVVQEIGQLEFLLLYFNQMIDKDVDIRLTLDAHSEYLKTHMDQVVNLETGEFQDRIREHFSDHLYRSNICFVSNFYIKPKFRGYEIGLKAMKDLIFHYETSCTLFILDTFPIQFETGIYGKETIFSDIENMTRDQEEASYKLWAYFQKLGFSRIPEIEDLMFLSTLKVNPALATYDLDDDAIFKKKR